MNRIRKLGLPLVVAGSMIGSGVVGSMIATAVASPATAVLAASTTSPTPATGGAATPTAPQGGPQAHSGPFKSNEDPTHEAGESAAREAQEDAGQRPTVP